MITVQVPAVPFARYQRRWCVARNARREWVSWRGGNYEATHRFFVTHAQALERANMMSRQDRASIALGEVPRNYPAGRRWW